MIYLGSALMVYNIYGFIRFARWGKTLNLRGKGKGLLYIPIVLLVLFLLGYIAVGIFGSPDIIVSGILFGGSLFVFFIYLLLDGITRRIAESEHLQAKLDAAEESSRAKSAFLASVSHEMRTPMNVIIGLDSIALSEDGVPEKTRDHLEKIGSSAKRLLGLINNILDMNSIESGELEAKKEEFSLRDALDQSSVVANTLCSQKGLEFSFEASECIERSYVGDMNKINDILLVIIDNAVKYTDVPGKVVYSVNSENATENGETVVFTVRDTGVGIDEEFLPKIFDPFTQEDASSTNSRGGSGLGLAAAKKTSDLLGGRITATSKKGFGSVFTFSLPLEFAKKDEPSDTEDCSLEGRRILIAEDLPENAEIVCDLLELEGVETEHALNGKIALDMFASSAPGYYDAILMDLRMPEMDGLEATRNIRKLDRPDARAVPILALTANAFESDVKKSLESGMNDHLAKPTDADTLYAALKKHIKRYDSEKGSGNK